MRLLIGFMSLSNSLLKGRIKRKTRALDNDSANKKTAIFIGEKERPLSFGSLRRVTRLTLALIQIARFS